ncbi:MAG: hypothetical protein V3S14_14915 [Anaerolineae bacterium]
MKEIHNHRLVKVTPVQLLLVLLAACAPFASPTPRATAETVQLLTPVSPNGTVFFDGCMYMLSHPPELPTADGILFQSPDDDSVFVFINARRRTDAEQDLSLDALAAQLVARWADSSTLPSFESVPVTDYLGGALDGLQADLTSDGQHARFMIVVRSQTLLGDLLPADVVYEIVAQASEETWSEWAPSFEIIFQTFHPKDCGGV